MTDLSDPNHPLLIQGRRHAREALFSAERFNRLAGVKGKAATVSVALQFQIGVAMTDGADAGDVYDGLAGALIWAINKLPAEDRRTVVTNMFTAVAAQTTDILIAEALGEPVN